MIRYHSFYPVHREGEYAHLMNDHDHRMMDWVRKFNPYDLYSKGHERPDVEALRPLLSRPDRRVLPRDALLVTVGRAGPPRAHRDESGVPPPGRGHRPCRGEIPTNGQVGIILS